MTIPALGSYGHEMEIWSPQGNPSPSEGAQKRKRLYAVSASLLKTQVG